MTLGSGGVAIAQSCQAPPGTAGIDQYCETIPNAGGNHGRGDSPSGGSSTKPGGQGVPSAAKRSLSNAGADGAGVLGLAQGEAGSATGGGKGSSSAQPGRAPGAAGSANATGSSATPSDNPLAAVRSSAQSGATLSPGFAVVLVLLGLSALGAAWFTYRSRGRLPQ